MTGWLGPILITGTDTGVGKTIVVAAIAAAAQRAGLRVAILKPAQTGRDDDTATIAALAASAHFPALTTRTLARYAEPLAPLAAARVAGKLPLPLEPVRAAVRKLAADHDLVLVEGAGGLLVPMGADGWTVRDLAVRCDMPSVVVGRAGLGTLNHIALTVEALAGYPTVVVLGAWPRTPALVHRTNLTDLAGSTGSATPGAHGTVSQVAGAAIAGIVPERAGALTPARFRHAAPSWLAPMLHGTFDLDVFRENVLTQLHDERIRHAKRQIIRAPRHANDAAVA